MQVYIEDEFIMIPMALNNFYHNIPLGTKRIVYTNSVSISEDFLGNLVEYIDKLPADKYIIIDMDSADYAFRLFEKLRKTSKILVFVNINTAILRDKIRENIPNIQFSSDEKNAVLNRAYDNTVEQICLKYSKVINHRIYVQIVRDLIDDVSCNPIKPQKLDSSGLYSNMYVNVKRLFLYPERYYAIAYGLAKKIAESNIEFDGFVSSSKNGALLANLLGMMLDKKAIHISGLGPKYSMNVGNLQKEIKRRKNYICVFDFRCTGTEMKVLSALIKANDAYVQGAVGIAVYQKNESDTENSNLMYLVDIHEEGIPYKVAGEEADIVKLMEGEKTADEY